MKLLWATPLNTRSAIAKYSLQVVNELVRRNYKVEVMGTEALPHGSFDLIETSVLVHPHNTTPPTGFDLAVLNFGNHYPFHGGGLKLAASVPPLSIFHDAEMRDFEWGLRQSLGVAIPRLPGAASLDLRGDEFDLVHPESRPIVQSLAGMSCGAVVHSPHYFRSVADACPGPAAVIPLCYPVGEVAELASRREGPLRVVIFGIIHPNKQPHRTMRALSRLKDRFGPIELHLAGAIQQADLEEIKTIAIQLDIPTPICHGSLSDEDLTAVLLDADAICCLRFPITEGGSASLITALYHGRPLVVARVASYDMVPDELLSKVSYGECELDLAEALASIFDERDMALNRAKAAKDWANATYAVAHYVDELESLMEKALAFKPAIEACRTLALTLCDARGACSQVALNEMAVAADELLFSQFSYST